MGICNNDPDCPVCGEEAIRRLKSATRAKTKNEELLRYTKDILPYIPKKLK